MTIELEMMNHITRYCCGYHTILDLADVRQESFISPSIHTFSGTSGTSGFVRQHKNVNTPDQIKFTVRHCYVVQISHALL